MQDAVELAQRVAGLLDNGRRVATYKLALLLALIDACAELEQPQDEQPVSILELADRIIDLYWPQVRTYDERGQLRQSTQARSRILVAVTSLRGLGPTPFSVRRLAPVPYERARLEVARTLTDQPLPALQRPGSAFLYDDTWLYDGVTRAELDRRGWQVVLLPGVADGLVRLSGLLRPVIERAWTDDVARLNHLDREHLDLPRFLFGAERSSLARAAAALRELQDDVCFYCCNRIRGAAHVDHFLPWSRTSFNGLSNLVLADGRCNQAKSDSLAVLEHRERWAASARRMELEAAGEALAWPSEWERSQRLARGLYGRVPAGTPLWQAIGVYALAT